MNKDEVENITIVETLYFLRKILRPEFSPIPVIEHVYHLNRDGYVSALIEIMEHRHDKEFLLKTFGARLRPGWEKVIKS